MYSEHIEKLIKLFSKFPTVGPKTASRFCFYLIKQNKETIDELITTIQTLQKIKICPSCFKTFETECEICNDKKRDNSLLCIVEKEIDLEAIEKTKRYKGLYFIFNDNLEKLIERIKKGDTKEAILGLNPTQEGIKKSLFLKRKLEYLPIKITQLGLGLPLGGELEYADEETLDSAFKNRS